MLDYQGEAAELEGVNETRPGGELQAVPEATGNINLNGGRQHEMEARTGEEDKTIQLAEPSKKHPGDALQADTHTNTAQARGREQTYIEDQNVQGLFIWMHIRIMVP